MNPVHVHLLLNHVAILAAIFAIPVFVYALITRNETAKNIALSGLVLGALAAIPVFTTGEPAEEAVEKLPGVLESIIEQHEEAAEISIWLMGITGLLALAALLMRKSEFLRGKIFTYAIFVLALVSSGSIARTGYLGGKIRHTEIAGGAANPAAQPEAGGAEAGEDDDD